MSRFARRLFAEWQRLKLPARATRVLIAASGGADSTALVLACEELQRARRFALEFIIAHLDHQLRGAESAADARWVEALARQIGFEALISQIDVNALAQTTRDNLEQAARRARYDFLRRAAETTGAPIVFTAHTLDDQAETFLLRLIRGSGAEGLGAMRRIAPIPKHALADDGGRAADIIQTSHSRPLHPNSSAEPILVRPLLNWARRAMTEEYCRARGVEFRVDAMNEAVNFARVRVRRALLPLLEEFNPRIVETLTRTAEILREDDDALTADAEKFLLESQVPPKTAGEQTMSKDQWSKTKDRMPQSLSENVGLSVEALRGMPPAVRMRVLRLWLAGARGDLRRIERTHLRTIENLIFGARGGRVAELPGGGRVERRGGCLTFRANKN